MIVSPYFWGFGGGHIVYGLFFILNICLFIYLHISLFKKIIRSNVSRIIKFGCSAITIGFFYNLSWIVLYNFFISLILNNPTLKAVSGFIYYPNYLLTKLLQPIYPSLYTYFNNNTADIIWFTLSPLLFLLTYFLAGVLMGTIFKRRNPVLG